MSYFLRPLVGHGLNLLKSLGLRAEKMDFKIICDAGNESYSSKNGITKRILAL